MAKKIERSRIEAGRYELPRSLRFLTDAKVDYDAVVDADGEFAILLQAAALKRLVKSKADLKELKAGQKAVAKEGSDALAREQAAHEATRAELAKAQRRLKALERKLASGTTSASGAAGGSVASPPASQGPASGTTASAKPARGAAGASPDLSLATPEPPVKRSAVRKPVAQAAATAVQGDAAPATAADQPALAIGTP